jgi:Mn-dependent DtxR family transcriptional regulator
MIEKSEELLSEEEWGVTLAEIELEGLIRYRSEDEIVITKKGIDYAWPLLKAHPPKERFALMMLMETMIRQEDAD